MSVPILNIETNLAALERNSSVTSANRKCYIYSFIAAIISLFIFRPLYLYRKQITYNKNKKPIQEVYVLSYYRCAGCILAYCLLFFLLFKFYLKI